MPIDSTRGGGRIYQPIGFSGDLSASGNPSVGPAPAPQPIGGAPAIHASGPGSLPSLPPPGPPVVHPVGSGVQPVNLEPPNFSAEGDGPPLQEKPVNFGKIINYGGTVFKANFGYSFHLR